MADECDTCESPEECLEKDGVLAAEASCECEHGIPCKDCGSECKCEPIAATEDCCPVGEEMVGGECKKISVTLDLEIDEMQAVVEASTGNTIIEIRGIAFHDGTNKNGWSINASGARLLADRMIASDVTLNHPEASEHGSGFTRNMDGSVDEATVGYIKGASYHPTGNEGYQVRYVAYIVRHELFEALESGLWSREDYGVSIGGSGVPVQADEDGIIFGEDFTFDHLAIVHRPAYQKANIENVRRIEKPSEIEATFICHSQPSEISKQTMVSAMTDEIDNTLEMENEIEALKADLVLASSRVAEFESAEAARVESDRIALVEKASEMGMTGHEDLKAETVERLIASWETAHPEPTPVVMEEVISEVSEEEPVIASSTPKRVVANYLNGRMVESDEDIYARCWNAWAKAWNGTLATDENDRMRAPTFAERKEMI